MGNFAQLNDDDAELLSGGVVNPSQTYGGSSATNYGQYKKIDPSADNPANVYPNGNYGQSK